MMVSGRTLRRIEGLLERLLAARSVWILALSVLLFNLSFGSHPLARNREPQNESARPRAPRNSQSLEGKVVSEEGQPIKSATVTVRSKEKGPLSDVQTTTDEEGAFSISELEPGLYEVGVAALGFVRHLDPGEQRYFAPGDPVTITMRTGGVITGRVTDTAGQPVTGVKIGLLRLRDGEDRLFKTPGLRAIRYSDDRGIYRFHGLPAGTYFVAAGGPEPFIGRETAYDKDAPTYFPSSDRAHAAEVRVSLGQERADVDITYRAFKGHTLAGIFTGKTASGNYPSGLFSFLYDASTGTIVWQAGPRERALSIPFACYGLPDGDYDLVAYSGYNTDEGTAARPLRISLRGRDVDKLQVPLTPLGQIKGRLVADTTEASNCGERNVPPLTKSYFIAHRDEDDVSAHSARFPLSTTPWAAADSGGQFLVRNVQEGKYHFEVRLSDENWYPVAITRPSPDVRGQSIDVTEQGVAIDNGQRVSNLDVQLVPGAASLQGKISLDGLDPETLNQLHVYLVPAELELSESLLRYHDVPVRENGEFSILSIAPGRYRIMAASPKQVSRASSSAASIWSVQGRAALLQMADVDGIPVELAPCQRLANYSLTKTQ